MTRETIVHWEPTGLRVPVPTLKPLLFGLLDAGVPLAYACMQGHCRTCRAMLTDGTVRHAPWAAPPDRGVRDGPGADARIAPRSIPNEPNGATILLCTAYPASPHLSLALHP